ncbi:MAG: SufS family cysteine desulfurase [Acidimicrobiales bacterium]|nr:SufS family cysteine desulfurase [Acidimicrobiales bacterium]
MTDTTGPSPVDQQACAALDVAAIKADFPLLRDRLERGHPIVFLDSAASSQKPRQVIDAMSEYYERHHANVHRGAYQLAEEATDAHEGARTKLARFINAASTNEVIFTRNATESINLVAQTWGRTHLGPGDAIVLSHLEHHSNIVPWQQLAAEKGFEIRWIGLTADGRLDLSNLDQLLDGAALLAISAASNVLGTLTPVPHLAAAAHAAGAKVLVDACQYVPHHACDVQALGADWIAFSAHKMCGPTGIGALWGREEILDAMPPFLGGGSMILNVTLDGFTTAALPHKFEAGTPAIAEAVGFGAAVEYLETLGMDKILAHEQALTAYAFRRLAERYGDDLRILGSTEPGLRCGLASFVYKEVHPHDLSQVLDERGVCVRAGHHCAKPLMKQLGVAAAARASWYLYNDRSDIDALVDAIGAADALFDW